MVGNAQTIRNLIHMFDDLFQMGPQEGADPELHAGGRHRLAEGLLHLLRDVRHRRVPRDRGRR